MSPDTIQEILNRVAQPSRYLGTEINRIQKDPDKVALRVALAFPDLYEIGMSHFGIQILYHLINRHPDVMAERVFAPDDDMAMQLMAHNVALFSLENRIELSRFDIVGFSLLYEMNYTNVLHMLKLGGIPFRADQRDSRYPLVIAGGPCTCNPEPVAEIFDAIVIGDGEAVIDQMVTAAAKWRRNKHREKETLLDSWSQLQGVYLPALTTASHNAPSVGRPVVSRAIVPSLDADWFPVKPLVPFGKPVHDRLRLEIARGCTRGCRFCQAGMIYRPVRERPPQQVLEMAQQALTGTGYEDLSLLSLSTGDYGCIAPLMKQLIERHGDQKVAISLPSLRAGTLTPELMALVRSIRKTGFTIAPEAGSQRLRDVINKNITDKDVFQTVTNAVDLGWKVIKLYFMIGLPTENDADLQAIVDLVFEIQRRTRGGKGRRSLTINVGISTFIPKPHTPFQWESQISLEASRSKINWLRQQLTGRHIKVKWQNPQISYLEGLWSRGDRHLLKLLETAYSYGCRFDGWSDHFDFKRWTAALKDCGIDAEQYVTKARSTTAAFAWDHIDVGVTKAFLLEEREKAYAGQPSGDCRQGDCNGCGVCDFSQLQPISFTKMPQAATTGAESEDPLVYREIMLRFEKIGPCRFLSHIELVNLMTRALRRSGVPLRYTQGFHPTPKIAFEDALPIGLESRCEICYLWVGGNTDGNGLIDVLNREMPEGIRFTAEGPAPTKRQRSVDKGYRYQVQAGVGSGGFDRQRIEDFMMVESRPVKRRRPKGDILVDLRKMVTELTLRDKDTLFMQLVPYQNKKTRPTEILQHIFGIPVEAVVDMRCVKLSVGDHA